MDRIEAYLKRNPESIDVLKILILENIEYPVMTVLFESLKDLQDELNEQSKL